MKKLILLILSWYVFTNASERSEWWVELITDHDGTVTKVKRCDYLEIINSIPIYEEKLDRNYATKKRRIEHLMDYAKAH